MKIIGLITALLLAVTLNVSAAENECSLKIGLITYASPSSQEPLILETISALKHKLPHCAVSSKRFPTKDLVNAIKTKSIDLFISSSGFYRSSVEDGAREIASIVTNRYPDPNHTEASAVISLTKSNFSSLSDLKKKNISALSPEAYPGYLFVAGEIEKLGYDWEIFFNSVHFTGPENASEKAFNLLNSGKVDAVILKHCYLEDYLEAHPKESSNYTVLSKIKDKCSRSTPLYPGWTLASTRALAPELSREITKTVLSLEPMNGMFWSVSTDFSSIDELQKNLRIGPYTYLRDWTISRFLEKFWPFLLILLLSVLGLALHSWRTEILVKRRTSQLRTSIARITTLNEKSKKLQDRNEALQRLGTLNQLGSILAHELRQPLASSRFYLDGLEALLKMEWSDPEELKEVIAELKKQNQKASDIIQKIRNFSHSKNSGSEDLNLSVLLSGFLSNYTLSMKDIEVSRLIEPNCRLFANRWEFELLFLNLMRNAEFAVRSLGVEQPKISISLTEKSSVVTICFEDNGPALSDEQFEELGVPFKTTKADGTGIGLQIVKTTAEKHGGTINFSKVAPHGLKVVVTIPVKK